MIFYSSAFALTCYFIATGLQLARLSRRGEFSKAGAIMGGLATISHGYAAFSAIYLPQGLNLGLPQMLSLITWLLCIITLSASLRRPLHALLLLTYPAAILALIYELSSTTDPSNLQQLSAGISSHIVLSILAYSVLNAAALQAIIFSAQDRMLREHHLRGLVSILPPLQTMEAMLFELLWTGFGLLTVAIITGAVYIDNILEQQLAHKTVFSILAWLCIGCLLLGRHTRGWRGRTAVKLTLWAFAFLILGFIGSKIALSLLLN